jgi:hypothetical protein
MSRRSLYRHSGRHQSSYAVDVDEKIVHWRREWVTPQLSQAQQQAQQTQAQSQANTPGPEDSKNTNGSVAPATTRDFKIKAWVPIDESTYQPVEDGEPDDVLDMQSSETKVILPEPEPEQTGGLTAADIRGAVGGDAIPGIVSQQYTENDKPKEEEDEKKEKPSNDPDVSMEEAPAS